MPEDISRVIQADSSTVNSWRHYSDAYFAKSSWTAEERRLKQELLGRMGLADEEKPESANVVDDNGELVFVLKVGQRKGLDVKYLREKYPEIYAECERWTYPISIRSAD